VPESSWSHFRLNFARILENASEARRGGLPRPQASVCRSCKTMQGDRGQVQVWVDNGSPLGDHPGVKPF